MTWTFDAYHAGDLLLHPHAETGEEVGWLRSEDNRWRPVMRTATGWRPVPGESCWITDAVVRSIRQQADGRVLRPKSSPARHHAA